MKNAPSCFDTAMIPRAAHRLEATLRLETTLLSSRQNLPRPARLYSTPSKRALATAVATAQIPRTEYPGYFPQPPPENSAEPRNGSLGHQLEGFLHRRLPYTIIPTPLPSDQSSDANSIWFTDSATQDLLGVMDACLHNLYDVRRARSIFERMREKIGNPALETRIYNAFLEAYIDMAASIENSGRRYWVKSAWELYDILESGSENHEPNDKTYAIMLLAWHR
jgi:DNA-directed RNA polymerase